MVEAGCTIIGGHSIRDEETKFGYSVDRNGESQKGLEKTRVLEQEIGCCSRKPWGPA